MTTLLKSDLDIYPYYRDGRPMADNTEQYRWIVIIKENLELMYADVEDVFIAGDLYWSPDKTDINIKNAPDVMVVFGRPKGKRLSYVQWQEDNIAPQVAFEILSPGNKPAEMRRKFDFYQKHGIQEYYLYDPYKLELDGWQRRNQKLEPILQMDGWVSPLMKIRFLMTTEDLEIYRPDDRRFLSTLELEEERLRAEEERQRAELERDQERQDKEQERQLREQAEQERDQERQLRERSDMRAEQAELERDREKQRAERLAARLRALNIDPDALD